MTPQDYADYKLIDYDLAVEAIRARTSVKPKVGLILGSGLGTLAERIEQADYIPYNEIPRFPQSEVVGHRNRFVAGLLEGVPVLAMQGRIHYYEGYSMQAVTFPIRVMQRIGIRTLIVTNAAGGLNPSFEAGDLMLITDHINFMGMAGIHPLVGRNDPNLGERFPDMSDAYDPHLCQVARQVAQAQGIRLREGVYIGLSGPSFETPAEVRMLQRLGADAVGMSTVGEVTVARHGGIRVVGFSGITNMLVKGEQQGQEVSHEEVLSIGRDVIAPKLELMVRGVLQALRA
ncbi:MAG: purine-nucleoside phosphorylase [Chloroflexota bacterium]|jgi:purine-nucleoside phosphorylase|nr:MAG: purine-nucleoside phosphorylase [Chloroflexota bacterium]